MEWGGDVYHKDLGNMGSQESYWESGNSGSKSKTRAPRPGRCMQRVHFALEVTEELESWPEKDTHERKWASHT
ncbi:hypothetical protein HPP92_025303 [Vanilla planifolia]|uniref:Uncharacterized protein n=1 Tax=Vanilla planifolia TaxID=51239 RepID=A0A835PIX7_VANPL|nr:hypothetical protein HPP92_025303 [Vanilla planifolia]